MLIGAIFVFFALQNYSLNQCNANSCNSHREFKDLAYHTMQKSAQINKQIKVDCIDFFNEFRMQNLNFSLQTFRTFSSLAQSLGRPLQRILIEPVRTGRTTPNQYHLLPLQRITAFFHTVTFHTCNASLQ